MKSLVKNEFNEHIKVALQTIKLIDESIETSAKICIETLKNGGKIILFGNGGSAADAQHIAAELVGRYKTERKGLAAIALTTDSSVITSISNDYGYERIFDRQIESLANEGDTVIGISTSGNSENVINGIKLAKNLRCKTIGLTGDGGGKLNFFCDVNIVIPSKNTPRIQEMHILIGHAICHQIDQAFKK